MIKNIIFDIGNVLVDFFPVRVLQNMGLSEEAVQVVYKCTAGGPHWPELDRGVMKKEDVFDLMIKDTPEPYKAHTKRFLEEEILNTVKSFDYSAQWLKGLKEKGLGIYLLTNYPEWIFNYHWKNVFTFTEPVDGKIVSGVVKLNKPDPAIYKALLEKYSLNPEECAFLDDRAENVQAAKALGIHGIQFTDFNKASSELNALLEK